MNEVCHTFKQAQIPWGLFGGAAVSSYDPTRTIRDVDILTLDSGLHYLATHLKTEVQDGLFDQRLVQIAEIEVYGSLNIRFGAHLYPFSLDKEMIDRCETRQLASMRVPMLSREDHLVLKAILQRGSESKKCDLEDILVMSQAGPLDLEYIQYRIDVCQARGRADELLKELGILQPV